MAQTHYTIKIILVVISIIGVFALYPHNEDGDLKRMKNNKNALRKLDRKHIDILAKQEGKTPDGQRITSESLTNPRPDTKLIIGSRRSYHIFSSLAFTATITVLALMRMAPMAGLSSTP